MASVLEAIVFEPAKFQRELRAFGKLLKSKANLSEMEDIQPFFRKNKHLTAYLGTFAPTGGPLLKAQIGPEILLEGFGAAVLIAVIGSALAAGMIAKVRPSTVMRAE